MMQPSFSLASASSSSGTSSPSPSSPSSSSAQTSVTMESRFGISLTVMFAIVAILSLLTFEAALGAELENEHQIKMHESASPVSSVSSSSLSSPVSIKREKRQVRASTTQRWDSQEERLSDIIEHFENEGNNEELLLFTPTTPSPEDVNCHVEIPVTRQVGGRCVNLGTFIGCQAGIYLAFDASCDQRLSGQEGAAQQHGNQGPRRGNPFLRRRNNSPFRSPPRSSTRSRSRP